MDALQQCAQKYAELCGYTYECTIARKNTLQVLRFTFSPYEFRHLAGLHRLESKCLRKNSERLLKDALAGKLTLADLQKASNWPQEAETILGRLTALSQLDVLTSDIETMQGQDVLMDEFLLIYGFSAQKLVPAVHTKIEADYLIRFELEDGRTFFFSVRQKEDYCGRSLFINNEQDYSAGQTKYTLLEKSRTNVQTGETALLYQRESYKK